VILIDNYGSQDVDGALRLEILTKIRDQAGNYYFRAWSENTLAIDISREWLKGAFVAKSDSPLSETIMPLLHVSQHDAYMRVDADHTAIFSWSFRSDNRSPANDSRHAESVQTW
jgi:hypothetical protein